MEKGKGKRKKEKEEEEEEERKTAKNGRRCAFYTF